MLINDSPAAGCGHCGVSDRRLLHYVRHRGVFRRLCTTCVLRLHPQSFCPTCFHVYDLNLPNAAVYPCQKCYSSSHSLCVPTPTPNPYVCPLCVDPNSQIFKLNETNDGMRVMDRESATKFLAAAQICAASMSKAAVSMKADAERKAKEAAVAREKAKEALDRVARLVAQEKESGSQVKIPNRSNGDVGGRNGGGMGGQLVVVEDNVDRTKLSQNDDKNNDLGLVQQPVSNGNQLQLKN